jgi:cytochrome c553
MSRPYVRFALIGLACLATATVGLADPKKIGYGRHLSSECTSCHRIDGVDNGIPSITGWELSEFIQTMAWYKDGTRDNQAMKSVAQSLEDDQIEALATYFQTIPKPPKKKK